MSVLPEVRVCAVDCNQNSNPLTRCIIHKRREVSFHRLGLVTDDSVTTNHPVMILGQEERRGVRQKQKM